MGSLSDYAKGHLLRGLEEIGFGPFKCLGRFLNAAKETITGRAE